MRFLRNEIKLIGKFKLVLALILSFGLSFIYYSKVIVPNHINYYTNMQEDLAIVDTNLEAIDIYLDSQINNLNNKINKTEDKNLIKNLENERDKSFELKEKFSGLKSQLSFVTYYRGEDIKELNKYWGDTDKFIKENFMDPMKKDKEKIPIDGYGVTSDLDWAERSIERNYIKENKIEMPKNKPYGSFVLKDFLSLNYLSVSLVYLIILLLGANIWSKDFEENEGKIVLSLPYERKIFYRKRFFIRYSLVLLIVILPPLILSIYSGIKYGFSFDSPVLVNKYIGENLFLNTSLSKLKNFDFLSLYEAIKMSSYNLLLFIYLVIFTLLIYSLVNFFNILTKNTILTLGFILFMIFVSIRTKGVGIYNILSYYDVGHILYGFTLDGPYSYEMIKFGFGTFLFAMAFLSIIFYGLGKFIFDRK